MCSEKPHRVSDWQLQTRKNMAKKYERSRVEAGKALGHSGVGGGLTDGEASIFLSPSTPCP
jgi:hypothetical protein